MVIAVESKKLRMADQEAIIMFLHFYKLVFLGTKFAGRIGWSSTLMIYHIDVHVDREAVLAETKPAKKSPGGPELNV